MIKCNNCENHFSNQSNIIETCLEFRACRALEGNRVASCKVDLTSTTFHGQTLHSFGI